MNAAAFHRLIQEIPYVTLRRKFLASPNLTHYDRLPNLQVNKTRKYWRTNKDQFPAQALRMKGVFVTYVGARVARSDESTSLPRIRMARVQTPASTAYVGWVCCWFSPLICSERFFPRYSGFPLFNDQYFQIPTRLAMIGDQNHYVDVLPKNRVIFIYLNPSLYGSLI